MAILRVHVIPNAKSDSVVGEYGGATKVRLCAAAVEGKANVAADSLSRGAIEPPSARYVLKRGEKSRDKLIQIPGLSEKDIRNRLTERD